MRAKGPLSRDQLRRSFELYLEAARTEGIVYTATGLDDHVTAAIDAVAGGFPNPAPELIAAAERAFEGQLDGSNAERDRQELLDRLLGNF